jgi:Mn2+/Fe2+ NRAMP family transporter
LRPGTLLRKLGPGLITGAADDDPDGVISVPIMPVMMLMAVWTEIMGKFVVRSALKWLGWLATAMMALRRADDAGYSHPEPLMPGHRQ